MTHALDRRFQELKDHVDQRLGSLSKKIKLYGALVALGTVAIPTYGQISTSMAQSRIESTVDARLDSAVSRAADVGAERAVRKLELRQQEKDGGTCE